MRLFTTTAFLAATSLNPLRAEKAVNLSDLPPAVQKTVQQQLKGGQIKSITKETEKGIVQYEVESMLGDKHRDFNVDTRSRSGQFDSGAATPRMSMNVRKAFLDDAEEGCFHFLRKAIETRAHLHVHLDTTARRKTFGIPS